MKVRKPVVMRGNGRGLIGWPPKFAAIWAGRMWVVRCGRVGVVGIGWRMGICAKWGTAGGAGYIDPFRDDGGQP